MMSCDNVGLDEAGPQARSFKMRIWSSVALAVTLLVPAACASGPPKHARAQEAPWHPPTTMLLPYAAADGSLTRGQMEAGLRRDFAKADTQHNGCLDDNQVRTINAQRWKDDASTASPLIDFKNNGCVDFDEFAATPRSLFELLDRKGNGKIPPGVLKPLPPKTDQASAPAPAADDQPHHQTPPDGN